jgi:hypothetical protein
MDYLQLSYHIFLNEYPCSLQLGSYYWQNLLGIYHLFNINCFFHQLLDYSLTFIATSFLRRKGRVQGGL